MAIRAEDGTACEVCQAEPRILLNHPDALQRIQAKRAARRTDGASTQDAPRPIPAYARPPTLAMEFEGGARPEGVSIKCVRIVAVVIWVSISVSRCGRRAGGGRRLTEKPKPKVGFVALWIYPR